MKRMSIVAAIVVVISAVVSIGFIWPFNRHNEVLKLPGVVEIHETRLGSKVGGRVAEILVKEGQEAPAGAELVRFESPELEAQRKQLQSRLAAAEAELKKALDGPRPQEKAEAKSMLDAALARIERTKSGWREELIEQAEEEEKIAKADWELADENFKRIAAIRSQVSKNEYEAAMTTRTTSEGRYAAAKAKLKMVKKGGWKYEIAEAEADAARAAAHLDLLNVGTRAEDKEIARHNRDELKAKLEEINASLAENVVKAKTRMIVEVLGVRKGDLVPPNMPIVRAMTLEDRWVKVFVPATHLGKLRLGQAVEVTCDAYPNKRFPGKIIQVATISEFTPRNVQSQDEREHQVFGVKVQVDDEGVVFKPGMAAEVLVPLNEPPK